MFGDDFKDFLKEGVEAVTAMLIIMGGLVAVGFFIYFIVQVISYYY